MKRLSPALALYLLSPLIGELLSSSSPPAEFFNPFGLIFMVLLYGSGAILVRELTVRWNKGWPTLLTLGMAYGIIEEGLACRSFFDPKWPDVGVLGSYGRWAGVNWIWSLELTLYHALVSIGISILLAELLFPERRSDSWVSRKGFNRLAILFAADVIFFYILLKPPTHAAVYRPSAVHVILAILITVGLYLLAKRLPRRMPDPDAESSGRAPRPFWFLAIGFLSLFLYFFVPDQLRKSGAHPLVTFLSIAVIASLITLMVLRMSKGGRGWSDVHRLALASGALLPFILLSPVWEFGKSGRTDNTTGMAIVGLVSAIFLIRLAASIRRRQASDQFH